MERAVGPDGLRALGPVLTRKGFVDSVSDEWAERASGGRGGALKVRIETWLEGRFGVGTRD